MIRLDAVVQSGRTTVDEQAPLALFGLTVGHKGAQAESIGDGLFAPPRLTIVVPTYCEADNVNPMIAALSVALSEIRWEVIFVDDDSPDETIKIVRRCGDRDRRVRALRRIGRRGLAGAVIEGMLAAAGDIVAVIDGDLQHDESLLPIMLATIDSGTDLVIASRYAQAGHASSGFSSIRLKGSRLATRLATTLLKTNASDPMSGFFMIRREAIDEIAPKLSTDGFKLLLDILATAPAGLKVAEVPYTFRPRKSGASKLDGFVAADFVGLVLAKLSGNRVSPRFFLFALIGASGLVVHLAALRAELLLTNISFYSAQFFASLVAMTTNFFLNNAFTFRDRRLTRFKALKGLVVFCLVCSVGTFANVGVAELIYLRDASWWRAGIVGALMAAVFNYSVSSALAWRR